MPLLPIFLIGGIATWYLLQMQQVGTSLNFVIRAIRLKGGTIFQPNIEISIGLQNPTNADTTLKSLVGDVLFENKIIAQFSSFETVVIKGNSETVIKINAIPNLFSSLQVIRDIIVNKQIGKTIIIQGKANVNNIVLPLNSSFTF